MVDSNDYTSKIVLLQIETVSSLRCWCPMSAPHHWKQWKELDTDKHLLKEALGADTRCAQHYFQALRKHPFPRPSTVFCIFRFQPLLSLSVSSVQSLSQVQLFATPWTAARQASLSITNFWSLLRLMSIKSVIPSNHLILCCPLLFLLSIFPGIRVFSNESVLRIK